MFYGVKKINPKTEKQTQEQSILVLWQIDGFEGGTGSRKEFLLSVARRFEKQNKGIMVSVITHTTESAETSMENGDFPHMISYSNGLKISNYSNIESEYKFEHSTLNKKTYALPWCRGNYYLFSHASEKVDLTSENLENKRLIVSKAENTQPLVALCLENYKIENFESYLPLDAYVNFVSDKKAVLLGTQRDVVRLTNRGLDFNYKLLDVFTDLYQYVSITTDDNLLNIYCQKFVQLLLSETTQKQLNKICMSSQYYSVEQNVKAIELMNNSTNKYTISPLIDKNSLLTIHSNSLKAVKGDNQAILNLKKLFNIPWKI